jgi:hypothetical protein
VTHRLVLQWPIVLLLIIMRIKCLAGLDLSNLKLIDFTKDGFATVVMKPIVDQARTSLSI